MTDPRQLQKMINRGSLIVNGPLLPLMALPLILVLTAAGEGKTVYGCIALPVGFVLAWLWWSLSLPRWRLGAMRQVDDLSAFHQAAWAAQVEWPKGHLFERTEIKPVRYNLQEHELSVRYYMARLQAQLSVDISPAAGRSDKALALLVESVVRQLGPRELPLERSTALEFALEELIAYLEQSPHPLYDRAWNGDQVLLRQLLSEYLGLLRKNR